MNQLRIGILDFAKVNKTSPPPVKLSKPLISKSYNSIKPLVTAIKKQGQQPVIYRVENCQLFFDNKKAEIRYNNKKIKGCNVLIPRLDFTQGIDLEISLIKQFQLMGIPVLNKYLSISYAKNKLRTLQILTQKNIPVPDTLVVRRLEYIDEAIQKLGGYPVIIKSPFGTEGREVAIIESRRSLHSALDIIWGKLRSGIILIQEYIEEAQGSDYRAFVVGDKVVAAMKRTAKAGEFRSNLSLGGNAEPVILSTQEEKMAIKATKALGLDICGVDLLRTKKGPVIVEMNANPGLEGITKVTNKNVADEIVSYAIKSAVKR